MSHAVIKHPVISISDRVKDKFTIALWFSSLSTIVGVVIWAMMHFISVNEATTIQKYNEIQMQTIRQAHLEDVVSLRHVIESQVRILRIERADDEIYRLDSKKTKDGFLSPEDSAARERMLRRLHMIETEKQILK